MCVRPCVRPCVRVCAYTYLFVYIEFLQRDKTRKERGKKHNVSERHTIPDGPVSDTVPRRALFGDCYVFRLHPTAQKTLGVSVRERRDTWVAA